MGRIKNTLTALALTGTIAFFGCNNTPTTQQKTTVCQKIEGDINLKTILVTSDNSYDDLKQREVIGKVEDIVNGRKYNIFEVKTSYTGIYLISAEIKCNVARDYSSRKIKVTFLHSDKSSLLGKQKEIKSRLDKLVNNDSYKIQDIKEVMRGEHLIAAEVYYYKNKNY